MEPGRREAPTTAIERGFKMQSSECMKIPFAAELSIQILRGREVNSGRGRAKKRKLLKGVWSLASLATPVYAFGDKTVRQTISSGSPHASIAS